MTVQYVHILLFMCPECYLPVVISRVSREKTLEVLDAESLQITCSYCCKVSDVSAVTARKHFVEDWA